MKGILKADFLTSDIKTKYELFYAELDSTKWGGGKLGFMHSLHKKL